MMSATNWQAIDQFYKNNPDKETVLMIPYQHDAVQLHSVIVLDNLLSNKSAWITDNTFTNNILTNSQISISQKTNEHLSFAPKSFT